MKTRPFAVKTLLQITGFSLVQALLLFGSAGTLAWWRGWAFLLYNIASGAAASFGVFRKSPGLNKERRTAMKKAKPWDKVILLLLLIVFPFLTLILAGFDKRLGWTRSISNQASLGALLVMVGCSALIYWAMTTNPFFSSVVRIQKDRGHKVVSQGPYDLIRHPAYLGMILGGMAIPIQLGSIVAFWVGVANFALVALRTVLEDRILMEGLKGYRKYAERVRYRLVPFVW